LIRGCGRTDLQSGSPEALWCSVHEKLYRYLPDSCRVYPGHDYRGLTESSIGEEKAFNQRLNKSKEEFSQIMNSLNLPKPSKLEEILPCNKVDGVF
jgi:sulfur dioxygenase